MPELPDVTIYVEALRSRVVGRPIRQIHIKSPFVLRSVDPDIEEAVGKPVVDVRRLGKRVVLGLPDELFLVFHLMIAGRFQWKARGAKSAGKITLATFEFENGTLVMTEASAKKRASLHLVRGEHALSHHDMGGLEPLGADLSAFQAALRRENHTLKRGLTDPRLFSGIGNAYSDEILHMARLSPLKLTSQLTRDEIERLRVATTTTLMHWIEALRALFGDRFPGPGEITAFREGFAVHGRYGKPCPDCGNPVQRIRYAENEVNYCAVCQTNGRLLADRSLSRLMRDDWPRTLEELEMG